MIHHKNESLTFDRSCIRDWNRSADTQILRIEDCFLRRKIHFLAFMSIQWLKKKGSKVILRHTLILKWRVNLKRREIFSVPNLQLNEFPQMGINSVSMPDVFGLLLRVSIVTFINLMFICLVFRRTSHLTCVLVWLLWISLLPVAACRVSV